jgi:hypothetical protein
MSVKENFHLSIQKGVLLLGGLETGCDANREN